MCVKVWVPAVFCVLGRALYVCQGVRFCCILCVR